mgnify:CR=1 FL=1
MFGELEVEGYRCLQHRYAGQTPCRRCEVWEYSASPKTPHRCPVCAGCGTVQADFNDRLGVSNSTAREQCRSCAGLGIVWAPA